MIDGSKRYIGNYGIPTFIIPGTICARVIAEALKEPILGITQVKIARMDEVHWYLRGSIG